jgi:hypothetical protein
MPHSAGLLYAWHACTRSHESCCHDLCFWFVVTLTGGILSLRLQKQLSLIQTHDLIYLSIPFLAVVGLQVASRGLRFVGASSFFAWWAMEWSTLPWNLILFAHPLGRGKETGDYVIFNLFNFGNAACSRKLNGREVLLLVYTPICVIRLISPPSTASLCSKELQ